MLVVLPRAVGVAEGEAIVVEAAAVALGVVAEAVVAVVEEVVVDVRRSLKQSYALGDYEQVYCGYGLLASKYHEIMTVFISRQHTIML